MTQTAKGRDVLEREQDKTAYAVLCYATISDGAKKLPTYWVKYDPHIVAKDILIDSLTKVLVDENFQKGLVEEDKGRKSWADIFKTQGFVYWAEKQFLPGVTDNLSHTIKEALGMMGISSTTQVASGATYLIDQDDLSRWNLKENEDLTSYAAYKLFHPLTESFRVYNLEETSSIVDSKLLSFPSVSLIAPKKPLEIDLELNDQELLRLSQERLLALNLEEMKAIKSHYKDKKRILARAQLAMPANPTDVEIEVIAQTWSEHCKHKIFNARINYIEVKQGQSDKKRPPHHKTIKSLYKTYIKGATRKLESVRTDLLSVFEDNSGVVQWNKDYGVCFKVETHNSPSGLEPYGGALTGILGVNRDILGTGLGAKPIFNTDVFCFAHPDSTNLAIRPKLLPPDTIPKGVRKGVEDGGNKSGIPTVNGAIYFHDGFRAKPLVFCGTGGLLPLKLNGLDHVFKHTQVKDSILVVGGRVGKDGIHGATFSSESMHEGSPVTAVQIGDPFTQKRVIDFVLAAQEKGLISGITDNGAGGLSSSVGEMASITGGARIDLARIPLKYPGLADWEIVISESQERMTISSSKPDDLIELAGQYDVEIANIGEFTDNGIFEVRRGEETVALLELEFLHDGLPEMILEAAWEEPVLVESASKAADNFEEKLLKLLSHDNISSREAVVRQYDHEVKGQSVIKQYMGEEQCAPCDAAVILPIISDKAGLVISNGICPQWSKYDTYLMATMAVDEAIRNGVCVGALPASFTLLDNFSWPDPVHSEKNPEGKYKLAQLVRACEGLYDACLAFKAPLISGKDSMKNDFDDGVVRLSIPPTLLISAMAKVEDISVCLSSEFKCPGNPIYLLSTGHQSLTGSHYEEIFLEGDGCLPSLDLETAPKLYATLNQCITEQLVVAAHDLSEGGLAVAVSESVLGSKYGANLDLAHLLDSAKLQEQPSPKSKDISFQLFAEGPSRILVEVPITKKEEWEKAWANTTGVDLSLIGSVDKEEKLTIQNGNTKIIVLEKEALKMAWTDKLKVD